MSSTNKTSNYNLSQYIGTDKPTYLGDYNGDMLKIDTQMKANNTLANTASSGVTTATNLANTANTKATANENKIGNLETLSTTDKTSLVNAINENVSGITSNSSNIGDKANLSTSTKTNLVSAINEVNGHNDYSTNESVCGKWIDGKTLYRKVISFQYTNSNFISNSRMFQKATSSIITNLNNIDSLILKNFYIPTKNYANLPSVYVNTTTNTAADKYTNGYIFAKDYISMTVGSSLDATTFEDIDIYIIIEYTKVSES